MKRFIPYFVVFSLMFCLLSSGCTPSADECIVRDDNTLTVTSPSSSAAMSFAVKDGQLHYRVTRGDTVFLHDSPLGLSLEQDTLGTLTALDEVRVSECKLRTDKRDINGKTAVADAPCVAATLAIGDAFAIDVRVFDDGAAFRYRVSGEGKRILKGEATGFVLPKNSKVYAGEAHQYYESRNEYHDPSRFHQTALAVPATVKLSDGGYLALLEGNLQDYPGMKLAWDSPYLYKTTLENGHYTISGTVTTPWRIVAVADDLNELVNNTIVYQVCDEADGNFDWIKPGRAAWSWITGRTTDRVTPTLMEDYTDYAAKLGFEYNIIDEGWINWSNYLQKLPSLAQKGEAYGVGQILWTGVTAGASFKGGINSAEDAYAFIDLLDNLGMAGGKIDFFTTEDNVENGVNLYRDILRYAADKQLVINFHGCNKPTGLDATFPNELNREAILGLEATQIYNRMTQAYAFVTDPFVRGLAGHADYTPAVDEAFHMAQLVLTDAPMQAIGSDPADILASPALEMIKSVPTVWQETVVLPQSDITKSAVIARKGNNGSWYVGGINYAGEETLTLDLSQFLGEGTYQYELWLDGENGLEKTVQTVTANDTVTVPFEAFSGFILRFDRVTLSQYGGEINPDTPLTITIHDPDTKIAYTLDGSKPGLFAKTLKSGDTLTLTESCTLTLKITSGDDKGCMETYRFNAIP